MGTNGEDHPIAEYALIGDCHATALVHQAGSIDWACLLRFDAPSVFARLLDAERGGHWSLAPTAPFTVHRRYRDDTMVLETTFECPRGAVRLYDFFAMRYGGRTDPYRQLVRIVEGVRGTVEIRCDLRPRFDYGALRPWLRHHPEMRTYSAVGGNAAFILTADAAALAVDPQANAIAGQFTVRKGERVRFSLISSQPHAMVNHACPPGEIDRRLDETLAWWQAWNAAGRYAGSYPETVRRSAMVLKLLSSADTGAIIAAPTTSLPEALGGARNWDYRYCWIRDAAMTMSALYILGHQEVAEGFKDFIERSAAGRAEDAQIMYGCFGERHLHEYTLDHLRGYRNSRPVRVGNRAYTQRQHDIFGELLDASYFWRRAGHRIPEDEWEFLRSLVDAACDAWRLPDHGIWEFRSEPRHFVHSKAMCWVAVDRGIQLAEDENLDADVGRWREIRRALCEEILNRGVDPERGCFVQYYGTRILDASLLRLSHIGFISPHHPHMKATVQAVGEDLMIDGYIKRYQTESTNDGVGGDEGTFLICTFWYIDALLLEGRVDEAEAIFRRVISVANDVGLLSEEYDPVNHVLLGNFPQAYTHMALVNSAYMIQLARRGGPPSQPLAEQAVATRHGRRRWHIAP